MDDASQDVRLAQPAEVLVIPEPRSLSYADARAKILDGDILQWRPSSLLGRRIVAHTSTPKKPAIHSHSAIGYWAGHPDDDRVLMSVQMLQWHGGYPVNLSTWVRKYSGLLDVYRPPYRYAKHSRLAALALLRRAGTPYGWRDFGAVALDRALPSLDGHTVTPRYTVGFDHRLFCSAAVADSVRRGGVDVLPERDVCGIVPGDLAIPEWYQFTVYWTADDEAAAFSQE